MIIFSLTVEEIADAIEDSDDDPDYIQKDQISNTSSSSDDEPEPNILKPKKQLKRKKSTVATIEDPQPGCSGDSNVNSSHQPRRFQKNIGSVLRNPKKNKEARVYMQPPIEAANAHSDEVCLFYSIL